MRLVWVALVLGGVAGCGLVLGLGDPELVNVTPDARPMPDAAPPVDAAPKFRIFVELTGEGGGHVRSNPLGIDCPGTCSFDFTAGTPVTLQGLPNGGSSFAGWTKACTGVLPCVINVSADAVLEAAFRDNSGGHNFVFVTEDQHKVTEFNPLTAADAICNASAASAGMPGTYVAWLSTTSVNARDRLGSARGWVRPDGRPFADTIADIRNGVIYYPIRLTAAGRGIETFVATGTAIPGATGLHTCNDWTTDAETSLTTVGDSMATARSWTHFGSPDYGQECNQRKSLYCFGVDKSTPLAPTPTSGRLAFLVPSVGSGGGVAAADMKCQMAASLAGKSGTFKALMATLGKSAAERFNTAGAPWVRADGLPLFAPGDEPLVDDPIATLNVTADGLYLQDGFVLTGAPAPTLKGTNATTCNDWSATTNAFNYVPGNAASLRNWFGNPTGNWNCEGNYYYVYCFQE